MDLPALQRAVAVFDFGDGGAFPELPVAQFPSGLGRAPASQSSATASAAAPGPAAPSLVGSSLMVVQTAQSALTVHSYDAAELQRPSQSALDDTAARTKVALEAAVAKQQEGPGIQATRHREVRELTTQTGQTRTVAVVEASRDPLDPSGLKLAKLAKGAIGDQAPVIRSPTIRAEAAAEKALKPPPCIKGWTNPKSHIIPIAAREKADGRNYIQRNISSRHGDLARALEEDEAQQAEDEANAAAQQSRAAEAEQRRQEEDMERRALAAVTAGRGGPAADDGEAGRRRETKDEREARREAELELKDREREERRKQRRLEKTARVLGQDVDAVVNDAALRAQALDAAPVDHEGQVDPRLHYAARSSGPQDGLALYDQPLFAAKAGATHRGVNYSNVTAEMKRQDEAEEAPAEHAPAAGEDPFGVDDLLAAH